MKVILDTNVLVSALLSPESYPGKALRKAIKTCDIYASKDLIIEYKKTLQKPKLNKWIPEISRLQFLRDFCASLIFLKINTKVNDCRDPKDNHILALAIEAKINVVITGDKDLLALTPYCNIPILTPREYLEWS